MVAVEVRGTMVAVEVRQGTLSADDREVRQGTQSADGRGSELSHDDDDEGRLPRLALESWQHDDEGGDEGGEEDEEEQEEQADIKSNNPHLRGGEKLMCFTADRWWMLRRRLYELAERQVTPQSWGMDGMDCMGRNEVEEVEGTNPFWRNKANESHDFFHEWIDMNRMSPFLVHGTVSTGEYEQWWHFRGRKVHSLSGEAFEDAVREIDNLGEEGAKEICHRNFVSDVSKASQDCLYRRL